MTNQDTIEIRLLGLADGAALMRLAQVDSASTPPAPVLGGIVGERLVAAHSLQTGESIADPFRRTAEIRSLLAGRAAQLRGGRSNGLLGRLRHRLANDVPRPATPASEALR
jgi:hypothetical protein